MFGLLDKGTVEARIVVVRKRDAATLLPIIASNVATGPAVKTKILSDGWHAYIKNIFNLLHFLNEK